MWSLKERIHLSFPPEGLSRAFSGTLTGKIPDGYGEDGCGRKVVGTEGLILTIIHLICDMRHTTM
jgi:hypothetical protein